MRYDPPPLFYVVDWLPPDFGAVGQYGLIFARELAESGRRVYLLGLTTGTSAVEHQVYPGGIDQQADLIFGVTAEACDHASDGRPVSRTPLPTRQVFGKSRGV